MGAPPTPWLRSSSQQQTPQSDYTRQVASGGLAVVDQARQQRRYGTAGAQANYNDTGVYSYQAPVARSGDLYDQWLAQYAPQAQTGPYAYGRTEDGAYAGYKNEGTLKAALRGRAEQMRGQDREMFTALDQLANQRLDDLGQQYQDQLAESGASTRYERTVPTLDDPKPTATYTPGTRVPSMPGNRVGTGDGEFQSIRDQSDPLVTGQASGRGGDTLDALTAAAIERMSTPTQQSTSEGLTRRDAATADRYTAMAEQQAKKDYQFDELNPWLADQSAPLIDQMDFAQSGLATPIAAYAQRAGAEFGIDPYIVGGWYPESSAIADARDQQTLAYLRDTGMTPADYEQALNALDREQQQQDQTFADQQAQAIDDAGYQLTQGQSTTSELSNAINLPVEDVLNILNSADYQYAQSAINDALTSQDMGYIEETVTQMLDAAATTDPAMLNILQTIYKDYVPDGYDLYGAR